MRVLVLFGSKSDESIYGPLCEKLAKVGEVSFDVISAHRDPMKLEERLLQKDFDLVVAGAGLAAHLPGVIASKTDKPVFGIPVASQLGGIDAFLAIVQMPAGIPVLTVAPNQSLQIIEFLSTRQMESSIVNIVMADHLRSDASIKKELDEVYALAKEAAIEIVISGQRAKENFNVVVAESGSDMGSASNTIYLPYLSKENKADYHYALNFFEMAQRGGIWVAGNNIRNAFRAYLKLRYL